MMTTETYFVVKVITYIVVKVRKKTYFVVKVAAVSGFLRISNLSIVMTTINAEEAMNAASLM